MNDYLIYILFCVNYAKNIFNINVIISKQSKITQYYTKIFKIYTLILLYR